MWPQALSVGKVRVAYTMLACLQLYQSSTVSEWGSECKLETLRGTLEDLEGQCWTLIVNSEILK